MNRYVFGVISHFLLWLAMPMPLENGTKKVVFRSFRFYGTYYIIIFILVIYIGITDSTYTNDNVTYFHAKRKCICYCRIIIRCKCHSVNACLGCAS